MVGLAVFGLKHSFLLECDRNECFNPKFSRTAFKRVFALAQLGKVLEEFTYIDGHVLIIRR